MFYFYIVRCSDNSLYCGVTTDITRRVKEHNSQTSKSAKYTRSRQPVILVYSETFSSINEALKREAEVKKLPKKKKETLIHQA